MKARRLGKKLASNKSVEGTRTVGTITKPGTKKSKEISSFLTEKAKFLGKKLIQR